MTLEIPLVPVSWGELLDKISILEIKSERISSPRQAVNVCTELAALKAVRDRHLSRKFDGLAKLCEELKKTNEELWDLEDKIRFCERNGDFGEEFVAAARSIYTTNDRRARLKGRLNEMLDSGLREEKSYAQSRDG